MIGTAFSSFVFLKAQGGEALRKFCRFRGQNSHARIEQCDAPSANRIMSTFYSRYVPPSRPIQSLETYDRPSSKRKHDDAHQTPQAGRKRVKTDKGTAVDKLIESQSQTSSKKLRTSQS